MIDPSVPSFSFLTLSVTYEVKTSLRLPEFPGSMWRGGLGWALREVCCFSKKIACNACCTFKHCLYARLYEEIHSPNKIKNNRPSPQRPFVLHLNGNSSPQVLQPGETIGFGITFFIQLAENHLDQLRAALFSLGLSGIGRNHIPVYMLSVEALPANPILTRQGFEEMTDFKEGFYDVELDFLTPLRLERNRSPFDKEVPFQELIRALLRRRHYLNDLYYSNGHEADEDLKREETKYLKLAEYVTVKESEIKWKTADRYSNRQKKVQSLSGLIGKIRYTQVPGSLIPLLRLGTLIHIGKNTSMGMGAYFLRVEDHIWWPPVWDGQAK